MTESEPITIQNRCAELRKKLERIDSADTDRELVDVLESIIKRMKEHLEKSHTLHASLKTMREGGVLSGEYRVEEENQAIQSKVEVMRKRLKENRSKIKDNNDWALCDKQANSGNKVLAKSLRQEWKVYLEREIPEVDVFKSFGSIDQCAQAVQELNQLRPDLVGKALPKSAEELATIHEKRDRMNALILSLNLEGHPAEMTAFLKRCATSGVPLSELTDEIFAWLKDEGFADSLKLTAGR